MVLSFFALGYVLVAIFLVWISSFLDYESAQIGWIGIFMGFFAPFIVLPVGIAGIVLTIVSFSKKNVRRTPAIVATAVLAGVLIPVLAFTVQALLSF